jgi:hypothetical protein
MRLIGTEMITFGAGLPVLYLAVVDVFLGGFTPAAVMFVGALSFLLIALGREMRIRGAQPNKASADAARFVGSNPSGDTIDDDTHPSNVGSTERLESREIRVNPARRIA